MRKLNGLFTLLALLIASTISAESTWRPEYANQPQSVRDWYANALLTPQAQERFSFKRCCAKSEVVKTKFKVNKVNNEDVWLWLDGATWRVIPPDIIHYDSHAPDGQPTLFVYNGQETCFFLPDGGI